MRELSSDDAANIYNGLDCCVTAEVYNSLIEELEDSPDNVKETYETALAKQAPFMEMMLRGVLIDESKRQWAIRQLTIDLRKVDNHFQRIMLEVFGFRLNWRSPTQLKTLFYGIFGLKEIKKRNANGVYTATVDREALERFDIYLYPKVLARMILKMRDLAKQISFLETEIDNDQRIRTRYNIAGTQTGRLSSSMDDFGSGTNLQNADRRLRYPFVADPGYYLVNIDLEQADGRNVGAICWNLFLDMPRSEITKLAKKSKHLQSFIKNGQWTGPVGRELAGAYLDACESGDLHTIVCRMVWPDLDWPEDESEWKSYCDGMIFHGQDSYRQLSKKGGHGTNYYGTPRTMAKHLHMPTKIIEAFQKRYFTAFPAIPLWHEWVIEQIRTTGTLTTIFGRRRMFFGRGNDAATHRKAIAYEPQSMTGEEIDRGLLNVWRKIPTAFPLLQVHDSILFEIPFTERDVLIPRIMDDLLVTIELAGGRAFSVPLEAKTGWNWGDVPSQDEVAKKIAAPNPHGMQKWKGEEKRQRPSAKNRLRDYL